MTRAEPRYAAQCTRRSGRVRSVEWLAIRVQRNVCVIGKHSAIPLQPSLAQGAPTKPRQVITVDLKLDSSLSPLPEKFDNTSRHRCNEAPQHSDGLEFRVKDLEFGV